MRDRFESKFVKVDDACWLWTAAVDKCGYGVFWGGTYTATGNPRAERAHRVAFRMYRGEIPAGMEVDHTCFTRRCVRPDHLRLGTHRQNMANRAGATATSRSGRRGVILDRKSGKWRPMVKVDGRYKYAGLFEDLDEAAEAAAELRRKHLPDSLQ